MPEKDLIEVWQEFISNEQKLPREYRKGIYEGIVESVKEAFPETKRLSTPTLMRMMEVESSLNPGAVNPVTGATGLLQVKPSTSEWIQGKLGVGIGQDLTDPKTNIAAGMLYLNYLQNRFKTVNRALQAYNVGPSGGTAPRYLRKIRGGG